MNGETPASNSGAPAPRRFSDEDLGIGVPQESSGPRRFSDADLGIGTAPQRRAPETYGQQQAVEDEAKVRAAQGLVKEGTKAGLYSAANTALFNIPSHIVSAATAVQDPRRPYSEIYKEQKEYEEALSRRNPYESAAGTAAGFVGGMAVPLGPLATAGRALYAAAAPRIGSLAAKGLEMAGISGTLSGASSFIEKGEADKAIRDAMVGAGVGAVAGPAISSLATSLSKMPGAINPATGKLSTEATKAIQEAFGNRLSQDDIQAILPQLKSAMSSKGTTPEAAREALLASQGIEASRSMVTGRRAPEAAADVAKEATEKATEKAKQAAETLIGTRPPEFAVAKELHGAERTAAAAAEAQYKKTFSHPGYFSEDFTNLVMPNVQGVLKGRNLPTSYERLPQYVYAPQAMKLLQDVSAGNMPLKQPINMRNLNEVNIGLNMLYRKASGEDRAAIIAMKKGLFDAIDEGIKNNLFYGKGKVVLADMKQAHALWGDYRKTFYGKDPASDVFKRALNKFKDPDGKITQFPDAAAAEAAQAVINSHLMKSNMGSQVYKKLESALGKNSPAMDSVNQYIRNHPFDIEGNIANLPKQVEAFLAPGNISLARQVFSPAEISQMRRLAESVRIINERKIPDSEKNSLIGEALTRFGPALATTAAGYFHSWPAALLAGLAAEGVSRGAKGFSKSSQIQREISGAPVVKPPVEVPLQMRNVSALYPTEKEAEYRLPEEVRPQRKVGGRVMSAQHMVAAAERAKKQISGKTEALLKSSDEHVAKALEIAKQQLEG